MRRCFRTGSASAQPFTPFRLRSELRRDRPKPCLLSPLTSIRTNTRKHPMKEREVWVTYLLWFLLGFVGVHKFYLGKMGWGILYIFTGGLFVIGWLVDIFTIPS